MSKEKKRKGLSGLTDDQVEILYRQTQDGMRKKGLPGRRRMKSSQYASYSDEDHSRARTVDKDFYRGKGSYQSNNSPGGMLRRMFDADKRDPETDPSLLFDQAFGDSYQRKNLSNKDIANMMIEVKDERFRRKHGTEIKEDNQALETRLSALERAGAHSQKPEGDMVIDMPGQEDQSVESNTTPPIFDESTTADTPQKDPQAFADQYKLDLRQQGANNNPGDAAPKLKLNPAGL